MKLCKYYSLDECSNRNLIFKKLEELEDDSKIEFSFIKEDDVIKIKNIGISSLKEVKEILSFFNENDVIDYPTYEEFDVDDEDDEEEEDEYEF